MPRDLIDLMERAASGAPPEPHAAADITRAAARHLRRRTTSLVAGLACAVAAAGALGYGVSRGKDAGPEPAGDYRYGQHQKLSDAVTVSKDPAFRTLHYDAPSVVPHGGSSAGMGLYRGIDADGRLLVMHVDVPAPILRKLSYGVAAGPGQTARPLPQPPPVRVGSSPQGIQPWVVAFTGDDHLLWTPQGTPQIDKDGNVKVSDLDGSDVRALAADTGKVPVHTFTGTGEVHQVWVDGGRAYFSMTTRDRGSAALPAQWNTLFSFAIDHPQDLREEAPRDALQIDVAHGEAVWVNATATKVLATDLRTGATHEVPLPLGNGCRIPPRKSYLDDVLSIVRTNGDLVALTEYCGSTSNIVVSDLSGRLVTEVDAGPGNGLVGMALGDRMLTFASVKGPTNWYADDLTTGVLLGLGHGSYSGVNDMPSSAGRYVLWYDARGGHVGELAG